MEIMIPSAFCCPSGWLLQVWWALILVKLLWVGSNSECYEAIEFDTELGSNDCWALAEVCSLLSAAHCFM